MITGQQCCQQDSLAFSSSFPESEMKYLVFSMSINEKKKLQSEWFSKSDLIKTQYELIGHEQLILAEQVFIFVFKNPSQCEGTKGLYEITVWIRKEQ